MLKPRSGAIGKPGTSVPGRQKRRIQSRKGRHSGYATDFRTSAGRGRPTLHQQDWIDRGNCYAVAVLVRLRERASAFRPCRARFALPRVHHCNGSSIYDFFHFRTAGEQMHRPSHAHEDRAQDLSSANGR
jgi:hypothetical protein